MIAYIVDFSDTNYPVTLVQSFQLATPYRGVKMKKNMNVVFLLFDIHCRRISTGLKNIVHCAIHH